MNCIIVDDDPLFVSLTEETARECQNLTDIKSFTSPTAALKYASECNQLDIALLDIEMHEKSGIELAKDLRALKPDIFVIFVTSYADYALAAFDVHATGYIIKPITKEKLEKEISNIHNIAPAKVRRRVFAHTFGSFDLFVDNKSVKFSSAKAKELLAYLIDRKGAAVTCEQAIAILWEDRPYDKKTRSLFRMILSKLRKTLAQVDALEILEDDRNSKRIRPELISCDYYDFLSGYNFAIHQYIGEYMQQYSWASSTAAFLDMEKQIFTE